MLVLVDHGEVLPPKSVGFGDSYLSQRLVCFVVNHIRKDVAVWHPFANGERIAI